MLEEKIEEVREPGTPANSQKLTGHSSPPLILDFSDSLTKVEFSFYPFLPMTSTGAYIKQQAVASWPCLHSTQSSEAALSCNSTWAHIQVFDSSWSRESRGCSSSVELSMIDTELWDL